MWKGKTKSIIKCITKILITCNDRRKNRLSRIFNERKSLVNKKEKRSKRSSKSSWW